MKKATIKQRIDNAVNAFFETEPEHLGEESLSFASDSALLKQENEVSQLDQKGDALVKILKQTFLFLPGAMYLFFFVFLILTFDFLRNPLTILAVLLIGSFLTIFGLGSLKNPKHLVIPLSILTVGAITFGLFSLFGNAKFVFEYGIYFFPLALVVSVLAKNWTDRADENAI